MKINKSTKSDKKVVITLAVILLASLSGYITYASINNLWPFISKNQDKGINSPITPDSDDSDDTTDKQSTGDETEDKNSSDGSVDYVKPGIANPPTNTTPYPIQNERYRIDQNSETSYTVELYPIINNPSSSDYDTQLKDYKNEVLDYLESRYGNVDDFKITWIPEDAEDI